MNPSIHYPKTNVLSFPHPADILAEITTSFSFYPPLKVHWAFQASNISGSDLTFLSWIYTPSSYEELSPNCPLLLASPKTTPIRISHQKVSPPPLESSEVPIQLKRTHTKADNTQTRKKLVSFFLVDSTEKSTDSLFPIKKHEATQLYSKLSLVWLRFDWIVDISASHTREERKEGACVRRRRRYSKAVCGEGGRSFFALVIEGERGVSALVSDRPNAGQWRKGGREGGALFPIWSRGILPCCW